MFGLSSLIKPKKVKDPYAVTFSEMGYHPSPSARSIIEMGASLLEQMHSDYKKSIEKTGEKESRAGFRAFIEGKKQRILRKRAGYVPPVQIESEADLLGGKVRRRSRGRGRGKTILTGDLTPSTVGKKTLLGD